MRSIAVLLVIAGFVLPAPALADDRPNIVLILVDDMGYTDIGAFGSEIRTPNIDALANGGIRLTNFHSSPQCAPTRSMLLSGSDNHKAGMGTMFPSAFIEEDYSGRWGYEGHLHDRVATMPERLNDAGYHTYMAGKWHVGMTPGLLPNDRGFDRSYALMIGSSNHFGFPTVNPTTAFREDGELLEELPEDFYSTITYTDKVIDYIDSNRGDDKPFFAYLAMTAPHWPMQVPEAYLERNAGRYDEGYDVLREQRLNRAEILGIVPKTDHDQFRPYGPAWDDLSAEEQRSSARRMELFATMMEVMDDNIGRLVGYLRDTGEFDNTLFFFMSDNGAEAADEINHLGFAGGIARAGYVDNSYENYGKPSSFVFLGGGWAQAAAAPYRMYKGFSSEGGQRVTAFAYHPTRVAGGTIDDQYLSLVDVMPTFLDIAEADFDPDRVRGRDVLPMDGRSFAAALAGSETPIYSADDVIATELHGQRALLRGDWKIVWEQRPINLSWEGEHPDYWNTWQLFDLSKDPTEQNSLAAQYPERVAEMAALWDEWAEANQVMTEITAVWPPPGASRR